MAQQLTVTFASDTETILPMKEVPHFDWQQMNSPGKKIK